MKVAGIYIIQSISKPERVYIGSAIDLKNRKRCHFKDLRKGNHGNAKLQRHFNKYGESDLSFEVIESGDYFNKNHLLAREQGWFIPYSYRSRDLPYFNISPIAGSRLGTSQSEEAKRKNGDAHRGQIAWNKGIRPSDETLLKIKLFPIGHIPWNKGKVTGHIPWNKGKIGVYTEEVIQKMVNNRINKIPSEESRDKMRKVAIDKPKSFEHIQHMKDAWVLRKQRNKNNNAK